MKKISIFLLFIGILGFTLISCESNEITVTCLSNTLLHEGKVYVSASGPMAGWAQIIIMDASHPEPY